MTKDFVALVGEGVQKREAYLARELNPRWSIIHHRSGASGIEARSARAAVAMPDALKWAQEMPQLKLLQLPGAGIDGLDPRSLPAGCEVCNVYEHEASVAEYVFACLFRLNQDWLDRAHAAFREGRWLFFDRIGEPWRPSLCGRRLGIVGFGRIGQCCASLALSLNMEVVAYTRHVPPMRHVASDLERVRYLPSVMDVAAVADYLLVACPLTNETGGLISKDVLGCMQRHAVIINIARSQIIDEQALFHALANETIRGAILDVWSRYPQTASTRVMGSNLPFHQLENVLMTPHLAANTEDMVRRRWRFIGANLNRLLDGEPRLNQVEFT